MLQSKDLCIKTALDLVDKTLSCLKELKNNSNDFAQIHEETIKECKENEIEINFAERNTKKRKLNANKSTVVDNSSDQEIFKNKFHALIDTFHGYISERFDRQSLKPVIELSECILTYDVNQIDFKVLSFYKSIINIDKLKHQMHVYVEYKKDEKNIKLDTKSVITKWFINKNLKHLDVVYKLFKLYLSIPLTSVTPERSFTSLRYIKNYLRSTQGASRLSDLCVIHFSKHLELDVEQTINEFISSKKRRQIL